MKSTNLKKIRESIIKSIISIFIIFKIEFIKEKIDCNNEIYIIIRKYCVLLGEFLYKL
jgi:hypothetical protein